MSVILTVVAVLIYHAMIFTNYSGVVTNDLEEMDK